MVNTLFTNDDKSIHVKTLAQIGSREPSFHVINDTVHVTDSKPTNRADPASLLYLTTNFPKPRFQIAPSTSEKNQPDTMKR